MRRYIDADKLLDFISEHNQKDNMANRKFTETQVFDFILNAPIADVKEVIHGHWSFIEYEFFICSACDEEYFNSCNSAKEAKQKLKNGMVYHYCPNCGASMKGVDSKCATTAV